MTFTDPANRRVAAHLTEGFDVMAEQQGFHPHTGSSECSFGTGMATAYHYDVKTAGEIHLSPRLSGLCLTRKKGADYRPKGKKLQLWLNTFCTTCRVWKNVQIDIDKKRKIYINLKLVNVYT